MSKIITIIAAAAFVTAALASPVQAVPVQEESGPVYFPVMAQPLDALDGDNLAQYVADHQAGNPLLSR